MKPILTDWACALKPIAAKPTAITTLPNLNFIVISWLEKKEALTHPHSLGLKQLAGPSG